LRIAVIGGGLAGVEAGWQIARRGFPVTLYEMRPEVNTPAHKTPWLAELVCSNSLKSADPGTASALLKEEMSRLGSLIMDVAEKTRVPAGTALAVERTEFARKVTERIGGDPEISLVRKEIKSIPTEGITLIATGPLTSDALAGDIAGTCGEENLYFYDAISPIISGDSIDEEIVFSASRYGKGEGDYLNCPFTSEEYLTFYDELINAELVPLRSFEEERFFEGCLPIEVLAKRGKDALRFGPLKPVGLVDPRTGKRPYAVTQLRAEDREGMMYSLVGFQTRLKFPEQKRVFSLIPGLSRADFVRLGMVHRNSYINAPKLLLPTFQLKKEPRLFVIGQLSGVEGYLESAASGLIGGINAARLAAGKEPVIPPETTAIGALTHYIATANPANYQPMNIVFGILPPLPGRYRSKSERAQAYRQRAIYDLTLWIKEKGI
jgi:methylenetetrahydrofolate--tRNA-(uracil-5-)-methyltransferase